ncbi:hypothetical protein CEXT_753211, partial [Caerostris extrusa]
MSPLYHLYLVSMIIAHFCKLGRTPKVVEWSSSACLYTPKDGKYREMESQCMLEPTASHEKCKNLSLG